MTDQIIKELEAENFRLRSLLARNGISVPTTADMPSPEEETELMRLVANTYPVLSCSHGAEMTQFWNALHFLAWTYRTDKLATQYSASFWFVDTFREWAKNRGYEKPPMSLRPFTAAAVASGVAYSPIDNYPYINFGLSLGSVGVASTAWKTTLRNRSLLPPTELVTSNAKREHNWA